MPLYEKYHVDLVFNGHMHIYERTWPIRDGKVDPQTGVTYITLGGAGGNLEDFAPNRPYFSRKTYRGHHYCKVDIFQGELVTQMFDSEGRLRDFMTLRK